MIVSLGIFTIVALVAVGALIKVMDANKKSIALKTAINNMNFTLESMSREMRVGSEYHYYNTSSPSILTTFSAGSETGGVSGEDGMTSWTIAFNSSKRHSKTTPDTGSCHLIYAYRFIYNIAGSKLQKAQQTDCETASDDNSFEDLISPEVKITKSLVEVNTEGQPYVSFFFKGYSGARAREQAEFTVQSLVSQRLPN